VVQSRVPREASHGLQEHAGQVPAAVARRDLGGQRAHAGGLAVGGAQLKAGRDGRVDARSQAGIGTVPGDRNGVALGQDLTGIGVTEEELPLGEDLVELSPSSS
jgi:hypothetical protein